MEVFRGFMQLDLCLCNKIITTTDSPTSELVARRRKRRGGVSSTSRVYNVQKKKGSND